MMTAATSRADDSRSSLATGGELAYEVIRQAIIMGELSPGQRLRLGELADRFGYGAGVLREALPRLVAEGFVESRAQLGYRVVELSPAHLADLTEVRLLIEVAALRQSIEHGDDAWEAEIVASRYLLDKLEPPHAGRADPRWLAAHSRFHSALVAACPNEYLREMSSSLRDRGEIFRAWDRPGATPRDIVGEHRRLSEAVLAHDVEDAVARLREHIATMASLFLSSPDAAPHTDHALRGQREAPR